MLRTRIQQPHHLSSLRTPTIAPCYCTPATCASSCLHSAHPVHSCYFAVFVSRLLMRHLVCAVLPWHYAGVHTSSPENIAALTGMYWKWLWPRCSTLSPHPSMLQLMRKQGSIPALDLRTAQQKMPTPAFPAGTGPLKTNVASLANVSIRSSLQTSVVASSMPQMQPSPAVESSLQHWQEIDACDYEGQWFQAVVVAINDHHIRVHFLGWEKIWCENIPIEDSHFRIRSRQHDSKTGPGPPQTIKCIMAMHRCGRSPSHCCSFEFTCMRSPCRNPKDLNPYVYFTKIDACDQQGDWCDSIYSNYHAQGSSAHTLHSRYQSFVVPPVGAEVPGVRVHYCGWTVDDDETIPSGSLSSRIRPRRNTTLYGPGGPQSEAEVRDLYHSPKHVFPGAALPHSSTFIPGRCSSVYEPALALVSAAHCNCRSQLDDEKTCASKQM